jgi:hypothetical protein
METFDNTNACRHAATLGTQHLAPKGTAETFDVRAGVNRNWETSLLHYEVTRPTRHAASTQFEHKKKVSTTWSYLQFILFCFTPDPRALHMRPLVLQYRTQLKTATLLTKKQINPRKGNKGTIWTIKSLRR